MIGHHIQFSVIDKDSLRCTKTSGEYKDLIVRVAGYSDHFNNLEKSLQDEIIEEQSSLSIKLILQAFKYTSFPIDIFKTYWYYQYENKYSSYISHYMVEMFYKPIIWL